MRKMFRTSLFFVSILAALLFATLLSVVAIMSDSAIFQFLTFSFIAVLFFVFRGVSGLLDRPFDPLDRVFAIGGAAICLALSLWGLHAEFQEAHAPPTPIPAFSELSKAEGVLRKRYPASDGFYLARKGHSNLPLLCAGASFDAKYTPWSCDDEHERRFVGKAVTVFFEPGRSVSRTPRAYYYELRSGDIKIVSYQWVARSIRCRDEVRRRIDIWFPVMMIVLGLYVATEYFLRCRRQRNRLAAFGAVAQ